MALEIVTGKPEASSGFGWRFLASRGLLCTLYRRHRDQLLEYDLPAMRETFGDAR